MSRIDLDKDWSVRYEDLAWGKETAQAVLNRKEEWLAVDLPCDIHMPLIEKGIIKEPLESDNCFDAEWTESKSWWFRKEFQLAENFLQGDVIELTLESLDAHADIFLNGFYLGHQRSAFYPFTANVKQYVKPGQNTLLVRLTSGLEYYSERNIAEVGGRVSTERAAGRGQRGDRRRAFVRKPQYVYGWDWGPRVGTCGIARGAWIESLRSLAIRGVHVVTQSINKDAVLSYEVEVENLNPVETREAVITVEVLYEKEQVACVEQEELLLSGINYIDMETIIKDAKLWWPNGMGEQHLYTIRVSVASEGRTVYYKPFKYGIRTLRLNLDRIGEVERLFAFEVNGIRAFCKGGNWIPADSIYARVTDQKYDTLIREAKDANFNMLRIWGGGIYERDIFYEKCDEYGIMIWHDFMFACALYPDHLDWFRREVEKEMFYQTRRLRNHPSMVLWCGNNENQWIFYNHWKDGKHPSIPGGIICYNQIAPRVIRQNCPEIPYWSSSPYGGMNPNDNNIGDRHHWHDCTMNPDMEKRITPEEYDKITSKFISEYGYIGPCRKSSIIKYHGGRPLDRKGEIWQLHNNTFEKETVPAGIAKHYADPGGIDMDEYLLYGGLVQGLMLNYSLEAIRYKKDCSGALFWMYDDCWGEVGWTIIDYYLKRKLSYYFVKRAFAPIKLIMREQSGIIRVMGINDTGKQISFDAEYGYVSFDGTSKIGHSISITLQPYSRETVLEFAKGDYDFVRGTCYVRANREDILSATLRAGEYRNLDIPKAKPRVSDFQIDGNDIRLTISSDVYAHAVHFNLDDDIRLSDEYFDLLPGEARVITVYGAADRIEAGDINCFALNE